MTQRTDPATIAAIFGAEIRGDGVAGHAPGYNVAPTDPILAVLRRDEATVLTELRWGLIPSWATKAADGARMFNARAETVAVSPAFRSSFAKRRCIVPTDGFYEWDKAGGTRQPYLLRPPEDGILALAGIWSAWKDPATGLWVPSASVITTEANGAVGAIHDRMPVLLPQEAWTRWLDPALPDVSELMPLLRPAPDDVLALIPVSTRVNSVRNDGPDLMEPVTPGAAEALATGRRRTRPDEPGTPGQGTLFG